MPFGFQCGRWPDHTDGKKWSDTDKENFQEYWLKRWVLGIFLITTQNLDCWKLKERKFIELAPMRILGRRLSCKYLIDKNKI